MGSVNTKNLTHWPLGSECDSKNGSFNLVLLIGIFRYSHDNALRWMPQDLTDDKSKLVHVMAWCHQATSHYLSQCWPRFRSPCGVTKSQWVKSTLKLFERRKQNKTNTWAAIQIIDTYMYIFGNNYTSQFWTNSFRIDLSNSGSTHGVQVNTLRSRCYKDSQPQSVKYTCSLS